MLGKRLELANDIALDRVNTRDVGDASRWEIEFMDVSYGKYRKWNGTCPCRGCRKPRYKDKGKNKRRFKFEQRGHSESDLKCQDQKE